MKYGTSDSNTAIETPLEEHVPFTRQAGRDAHVNGKEESATRCSTRIREGGAELTGDFGSLDLELAAGTQIGLVDRGAAVAKWG